VEFNPDLKFQEESNRKPTEESEKNLFILLDECLDKLNPSQKKLLISYYSKDKNEKIKIRKVLAKEYNINVKTLHVKIHRIKNKVKRCMEKKIKKKL
jgi:DNA-directed RNA polymerase specialized sigma24 family protein